MVDSVIVIHPVLTREYCQFEVFNASCASSQVIVMEEAQYGRLQLGRCVTRDYGYIGCSANVIDLLDRACSGQRWCQLGIPTLREIVQPCPKDLTAYLEASYRCITGNTGSGRSFLCVSCMNVFHKRRSWTNALTTVTMSEWQVRDA